MEMNYKVCAFTGTRAEFGLLKETLLLLKNEKEIDLNLVVTGSHLSPKFGDTIAEIIAVGFEDVVKLPIPLDDDSKAGMITATSAALSTFGDYLARTKPDIVLVLGDRYEIFAAAIAAHMLGIPIAHISGGDVTEGAIDDAIRHSITKMSRLHFPGCEQSRLRIIQMGEDPNSVFNVGEPGVENCLKTNLLSRAELKDNLGFEGIENDYGVVTFHPVTMEDNTGEEQVKNLIRAMDTYPDMSYIITLANADAGGRAINEIWQTEGDKRNNWFVVSSLGVVRYLSALKYSKLVLGNSSSGIVEAPAMGIPTVNIGDRQKGRMMPESVINCEPTYEAIRDAMSNAIGTDFQVKAQSVESPYGDGHTSELIVNHIMQFLQNGTLNRQKKFYDIDFEFEDLYGKKEQNLGGYSC